MSRWMRNAILAVLMFVIGLTGMSLFIVQEPACADCSCSGIRRAFLNGQVDAQSFNMVWVKMKNLGPGMYSGNKLPCFKVRAWATGSYQSWAVLEHRNGLNQIVWWTEFPLTSTPTDFCATSTSPLQANHIVFLYAKTNQPTGGDTWVHNTTFEAWWPN